MKAKTCRRKLLLGESGPCAEGRLDSGIPTYGAGSASAVTANDTNATELLDRALLPFMEAVDDQCFGANDVDLVDADTGLGFNEDPQAALELVDLLNRNPNGVGCVGNEIVLKSYPFTQNIICQVLQFQNTCLAVGPDGPGIGS